MSISRLGSSYSLCKAPLYRSHGTEHLLNVELMSAMMMRTYGGIYGEVYHNAWYGAFIGILYEYQYLLSSTLDIIIFSGCSYYGMYDMADEIYAYIGPHVMVCSIGCD